MKIRIANHGSQRGAVATVMVVIIVGLMGALVIAGADTVRRARRTVRAVDAAQAKHWARVAAKGR